MLETFYNRKFPAGTTVYDMDQETIGQNERLVPKGTLLRSLATVFSYIHGYPVESFISLSDYNDIWMFFCIVEYPPLEYNEALSKLTVATYGEQLAEFLGTLCGTEYDTQIFLCEEYEKW